MIVKFLDKLGNLVKSITSIAYLPVDVEPVKDSKHLITSGAVGEIVPEGTSSGNPLMNTVDTERLIDIMKPIDAMTLRFEFSKKDYNPETAGVGSAGTWKKVDSPTLNIWDWTNEATDWSESFMGAFPDTDNEVSVIAAGDTSDVTSTNRMFAGLWDGQPLQGNLITRNAIVRCCPFNIDNVTDMTGMFLGTSLENPVHFDFSGNNENCVADYLFADTFIQETGNIEFRVAKALGMFARSYKLKKVGVLSFDNIITNIAALFWNESGSDSVLESVDGIIGTDNVTSMQTTFQNCEKLKRIGGKINCSSVSNFQAFLLGCRSLEGIPELEGIGNAEITNISYMFGNCFLIKEVPLFDTSHASNARNFIASCYELKEIPDYDFSSVTNVRSFAQNTYKIKYGILETYNKFLARGTSITNHLDTFLNCGRDTKEGQAALAQIPQSWGGLAEG